MHFYKECQQKHANRLAEAAKVGGNGAVFVQPFFQFPLFDLSKLKLAENPSTLGFLTWQGTQIGRGILPAGNGMVPAENMGLDAGPVVLYSGEKAGNKAVVISPANHFQGSVMYHDGRAWSVGMNGEITSVPAGYAHKTIFVVGDGATNAMDRFGTLMRSAYNTHKADGPDTEITVNWLGYWCANTSRSHSSCVAGSA